MCNKLNTIKMSEFNSILNVSTHELFFYRSNSKKKKIKLLLKEVIKGKIWKEDNFFWPHALLALSLEEAHQKTGNPIILDTLVKYYDLWIEKGLQLNDIDNAMNGYSMLYVYEQTDNIKYLRAADKIAAYLVNHNTDKKGSIPYRIQYSNDILIDGLGMICPFLCRYESITSKTGYVKLAMSQFINFFENGIDEQTELPYHAFNSDNGEKIGIIGWGRAAGWLMIGLIDSLLYIERNNSNYDYLLKQFSKVSNLVVEYLQSDGYYSWQLGAKEGHRDTSTTSMITYALLKGVINNHLDAEKFIPIINASVEALLKSTVNGKVLDCSAECMGVGMYPQNFGTYPWSQGPTTAILSTLLEV